MTRSRLFLLAFFAAAILAFVMAVLPAPPVLVQNFSDKVQHAAAFAVLTLLAAGAFPRVRPIYILLGLSGFGGLIEIVQGLPAVHRDSDWFDWLADTAAILGALAVIWPLRRLLLGGEAAPKA